ncbi:MAG: hypothetical protein GDA50_04285 [Alphaproteobacteria bacterium GM202ARS2]|nr:hypothetical protein [Alphaproteobacteria bacterium GM202ARS2]
MSAVIGVIVSFLKTRLGLGLIAGLISVIGVNIYLGRRDARVAADVIKTIEDRNDKGIKAANRAGRKSRSARIDGVRRPIDPFAK